MARSTDISPLAQVLSRADAVADGAPSPDTIPTGFPSLDRILGGGLRGGDLRVDDVTERGRDEERLLGVVALDVADDQRGIELGMHDQMLAGIDRARHRSDPGDVADCVGELMKAIAAVSHLQDLDMMQAAYNTLDVSFRRVLSLQAKVA